MYRTLASATLQTSDAAVGRTLGQAQTCADTLTNTRWDMFDAMRDLQDHRRDAAASVLSRLSEVLTSDEHVVPLKSRLEELERDAMRLQYLIENGLTESWPTREDVAVVRALPPRPDPQRRAA